MAYVIDGRHLDSPMGGVQRVLREMLLELDTISKPGEYEILMPPGKSVPPEYKNLRVIRYGCFSGLLWEQVCLPWYLLTRHKLGVFPCTIVPLIYPKGLAIVHDIMAVSIPEVRKSFSRNPAALIMLEINYRIAITKSSILVTDTEHSKKEIIEYYSRKPDDIHVIGMGWQHILRVKSDHSWKDRFPQLQLGQFYFSLSANRVQKNFKWILEVAKRNPNSFFAVAGGQDEWQKKNEIDAPNLIHLGYVSDGEIRSLMENCKAFLFPSLYEGFGIPPMEALAVGAKTVVSNTSCLPEIYQNSVYYIDPYDYDTDLDVLINQEVAPAMEVLDRFSWRKLAEEIDRLMKTLDI